MHPNCRSTTIAYFGDVSGKRIARDDMGNNYYVPADMNYRDWRASLTDEQNRQMDLNLKMSRNELADREQYQKYKEILGKNAPKSFADFQEIKYNSDNWNLLKLDYQRQNRLVNNPGLALPSADRATAADAKFDRYLFNPDNQEGYAKGRAFTSRLGYDISNWGLLQVEVLDAAGRYPVSYKKTSIHGIAYEQKAILHGIRGFPANVIIGWLVNDDGTKMTTLYIKEPDKSDN